MAKEISADDRLKAMALAITANDYYRRACEIDMTMQRILGQPARYFGEGALGGVIYDGVETLTVAKFDEAFAQDGFTVAVPAAS